MKFESSSPSRAPTGSYTLALQTELTHTLEQSAALFAALVQDAGLHQCILAAANTCIQAFQSGRKLLLAGNGGSAADAQHIAAEFIVRFAGHKRAALPAIALTTDSSIITAAANDWGYEAIFARQIEALGQKGDVFWGYSTSGTSANVLAAARTARECGLLSILFTGQSDPNPLSEWADVLIRVPHTKTARIQEAHALIGHAICQLVESALFPVTTETLAHCDFAPLSAG